MKNRSSHTGILTIIDRLPSNFYDIRQRGVNKLKNFFITLKN